MAQHVLLEYTVLAERLDQVQEAARGFLETSRKREGRLRRHQAYRIEGTRTFVHVLAFEDGLAAREHRSREHTESFTEALEGNLEGEIDLRGLEPVEGDSGLGGG